VSEGSEKEPHHWHHSRFSPCTFGILVSSTRSRTRAHDGDNAEAGTVKNCRGSKLSWATDA